MDHLQSGVSRPVVGADGVLLNGIGSNAIALDDNVPIGYGDLRPLSTYVSHGVEYLTDENALPARARGALRWVPVRNRIRHARVQLEAGRLGGKGDQRYHGGHIVAVFLGGFPSGPNLIPQVANFNVSAWKRLENGWKDALQEGVNVTVDIAITMDPVDFMTPPELLVTYWEEEHEWNHAFLNEAEAQ